MSVMSTDARLAADLARDPRGGLAAVYAAYADRLYSYAVTMLRDPNAAQDVVHDSLLSAAGSIHQLRDHSRFRPWLYAITRNECLRTIRGKRRFVDSEATVDVADDSTDFDRGLRREEASRLVAAGMAAMSPADRDILSLAIQHDLDVERVSLITGTATNALHARLSRARVGLSDALGALVLYRTRGKDCEELATILQKAQGPLTPLLRKRIHRHVKSCDTCERRRRSALAALGPAMAAPVFLVPPESLRYRILQSAHTGEIEPLSERAGPFRPDGFPVALDSHARRPWLPPAVAAMALLLIGALFVW